MNAAEKAILTKLLEGRYNEAILDLKNIDDQASEELLRAVVLGLSEASGFAQALCEGRLAAVPPSASNPFCKSLTSLQKLLGQKQKRAKEKPPRSDRVFDKDVETGLLSRRAFLWEVRDLLENDAKATGVMFSVGLDNLRYVNDRHGYESGDLYIAKVVEILKMCQAPNVRLSRPAGDEFAVYAHGFDSETEALEFAQQTRKRLLNTILELPGETVRLRTSQGAALYPADAMTSDVLLNYATHAMFSVQNFNRGTFMRFNPEVYRAKASMLSRQERLDELLEERRIHFAFQPVVNLHDATIYGYEALMRSTRSDFPSPLDILQLAEVQYKLPQLEYVTFLVIFDWVAENLNRLGSKKVFFNVITANYLNDRDLSRLNTNFMDILRHMVIEITETSSIEGEMTRRINQFRKDFSTLIAIDDYGCAYSNIYRLLNLLPEIVKLDRFFISDIHKASPDRKRLIGGFLNYCHSKNILTVAEGVETVEELEAVIKMGFDLCQGYYLGRPEFELREIAPQQTEEILRFAAETKDLPQHQDLII
ncbi:MAG: EAL domain-containing protein [Desulfovibrio sp.]|nr:EAL domain-containing protein [Desulfovibrio sp.]